MAAKKSRGDIQLLTILPIFLIKIYYQMIIPIFKQVNITCRFTLSY